MPSNHLTVPNHMRSPEGHRLLTPPTYERVDSMSQESADNITDFDLDSIMEDNPATPLNQPSNDFDDDDRSSWAPSEMEFRDVDYGSMSTMEKILHIRHIIRRNVVRPVQRNIVEPVNEMQMFMYNEIDRYLSQYGNPLIIKRFLYIVLMTFFLFIVVRFGDISTGVARGSKGTFSSHRILFDHTKKIINLNQFETHLEYLSSMPHGSGTKGDVAMKNYVRDTLKSYKMDEVFENELRTYSNYPTMNSTLKVFHTNLKQLTTFELTEENYNPLTINGRLSKLSLIYGHYGSDEELKQLHKISVLGKTTGNYILLLKYNKEMMVSEQIMTAQKYNAKAVIFISQEFNGDKNVVQMRSAGLPQFATGDVLTPGYYGSKVNGISPEDSKLLTNIPVVTLTRKQGEVLMSKLSRTGLLYKDGMYSGNINDLRIDLESSTVEKRRQPLYNIIGRIDGREQNNKALIIGAARNVHGPGAMYPNFGTATMLSLVKVLQELKHRFNWKPLRSIYFASFGGSEFNFAGSTEQMELDMLPIHDGIYSYIDISQIGLSNDLQVQTSPLMSKMFQAQAKYMRTFNVSTMPIQTYGDWIPFMANGIPSASLSTPANLEKRMPIETLQDTFELIHELLKDTENQENVKDIIFYLTEVILKMIDEPIIPFDLLDYVQEIDVSLQSMLKLYKHRVDLTDMLRNILKWKKLGNSWHLWHNHWTDSVWKKGRSSENEVNKENRLKWNERLSYINKYMCDEYGLPNRDFYKNVLFGPPLWNEKFFRSHDYNPWSFPAVKDAISNRDWSLANDEVQLIGKMFLDSAEAFMRGLKILV